MNGLTFFETGGKGSWMGAGSTRMPEACFAIRREDGQVA